ncbi:PREDICTED: T-cell surface glycoprotein CD3 epsilon chain isoform X2 [Chinchilla lanigera]|uniref:T-cell surface glycoprotein CD3 epsilon chain isoform X2 n=1 Tax=Chinchilla lanigera TaxID=34839 RepID=UPI00038EE920|nr:PREDICTED: T-cell surface glycoprotein CD3 epsilon chain isoform X2 [Chinchilla lanigera]
MQSGALWRVLGLCLLSVGAWGQEGIDNAEYKVSISGTTVEVTCFLDPSTESIQWEKNHGNVTVENPERLTIENFSELEHSGYYACFKSNSDKDYYLYLKARVCENCMEVDLTAVFTIIIVDICITLGLLVSVYYWSKNRKAKAKPVKRGTGGGGRPRGQNKERPPPVPNPDYEPIRKGQRDLYSGLNQRGV